MKRLIVLIFIAGALSSCGDSGSRTSSDILNSWKEAKDDGASARFIMLCDSKRRQLGLMLDAAAEDPLHFPPVIAAMEDLGEAAPDFLRSVVNGQVKSLRSQGERFARHKELAFLVELRRLARVAGVSDHSGRANDEAYHDAFQKIGDDEIADLIAQGGFREESQRKSMRKTYRDALINIDGLADRVR